MSFYFTRTIHQKGGVVKSQWCGRNKENVYQLYASSLKKKNLLEKKVDQEQCSVSNFMIDNFCVQPWAKQYPILANVTCNKYVFW